MGTYMFAVIEALPSAANGAAVPGPVQGVTGVYSNVLRPLLTRYWDEISGGRLDVQWFSTTTVMVPLTAADWVNLNRDPDDASPNKTRIKAAVEAAGIPDGVFPIVISNVENEPTAGLHVRDVGIIMDAGELCPAVLAHEMGHFFQRQGSGLGGHADVLRSFYRDEYADRTCVMGSDAGGRRGKYTFIEASLPPLLRLDAATGATVPIRQPAGPAMCPAQADRCGWVEVGTPGVAEIDPNVLGPTVLQQWTGAPKPDAHVGAPVVAVLDGWAPDNGRLYASVRDSTGWDDGFWPFGAALGMSGPRVYLHMSTPLGDSVLLGECPAVTGESINAGAAPVELVVGRVSPEGVEVTFAQNPWRGWGEVEGVRCSAAARIAACTDGQVIDAFVIDEDGAVRRNRYDGSGWEAGPWPELAGVTADPGGGIAAVHTDTGVIRVFVVADDGVVRERRADGSDWSSNWRDVDGVTLDPTSALAAACVDGDGVMLAGSLSDGMVLRCYLGPDGPVTNWHTAPGFPGDGRAAHAGAQDDSTSGRTYGIATSNPDRSVWAWPGVDDPRDNAWGVVGELVCDPRCALAAGIMRGASHLVVVGTDPMICLVRRGAGWNEEWPTQLTRDIGGGIAVVSRRDESADLLAIDRRGRVTVTARSPHVDYVVPSSQYQSRRIVALRASNGDWMTAKSGGGEGMGADAHLRREWETFTMHGLGTYRGDSGVELELVALQAYRGQYVTAKDGGGSHVTATAGAIGPWEKFVLAYVPGAGVTLRCINETHYLVANGGGGQALSATAVKGVSTAAGGGAVFGLNVF